MFRVLGPHIWSIPGWELETYPPVGGCIRESKIIHHFTQQLPSLSFPPGVRGESYASLWTAHLMSSQSGDNASNPSCSQLLPACDMCISPQLQVASNWWLEFSSGGSIYTTKIGNHHRNGFLLWVSGSSKRASKQLASPTSPRGRGGCPRRGTVVGLEGLKLEGVRKVRKWVWWEESNSSSLAGRQAASIAWNLESNWASGSKSQFFAGFTWTASVHFSLTTEASRLHFIFSLHTSRKCWLWGKQWEVSCSQGLNLNILWQNNLY